MKNLKYEIGGWKMLNPELVIKLGFILDEYKKPQLETLWRHAEAEASVRLAVFYSQDLFYQEEVPAKSGLIYSFRYYTPISNRVRLEPKESMT